MDVMDVDHTLLSSQSDNMWAKDPRSSRISWRFLTNTLSISPRIKVT